jgi:hypothetical protein
MGRLKDKKETIWDSATRLTWQESIPMVRSIQDYGKGVHTTKTSVWTNTVRNWIRQEAGEIEVFHALEIGAANWCQARRTSHTTEWK